MKIRNVNFDIWIRPYRGGKQFQTDDEAEQLLSEIVKLIEDKGYFIKRDNEGTPDIKLHISKGE